MDKIPHDDICYICLAAEFRLLLKINDNVSVVKCMKCGMARTYPYPDFNFTAQEKYSKFYLDNEAMFRMFAHSMMDVVRRYRTEGNILDIGCSVGYLLDEARVSGFKGTSGIELNLDAARIARSSGHEIYTKPLGELTLEKEAFSVIVFNHVLEHILDIKLFLREVKKYLKEDGIIYCGAPNYNSLMRLWLGKNWYGWGMPDHIWHFDVNTFRSIIEGEGFLVRDIVQNALYYPYSKSLRKNTRATIARIADKLGYGDQVYGIFSKGRSQAGSGD